MGWRWGWGGGGDGVEVGMGWTVGWRLGVERYLVRNEE